MVGIDLQLAGKFCKAGRVHGFKNLRGFQAKPELYSRKEGEMLQNPLSPELPGASALCGDGAVGH